MDAVWLIYNPRSRTADAALADEVSAAFEAAGRPVARRIELGEADLPDAEALRAAGVGLLAVLSGDGSMSALATRLDAWEGDFLVLPGGTMNLLSRLLHGEAPPLDIVAGVLSGAARRITVPTIEHADFTAYTGVIAGPTAAWGDVREAMRQGDLAAMGEDALRAAAATFDAPGVRLDGSDTRYPAIFIEPGDSALRLSGVRVNSAADLLAHGWAWLRGDFRNGPFEPLADVPHVTLTAGDGALDLLVDGETETAADPATFRSGRSGLHFLATGDGGASPG